MLRSISFIVILINLSLIQTYGRVTERGNQPLVTLNEREICANKGDTLTLSCTMAFNSTRNALTKWTLLWQSEGENLLENVTNRWQNSSHLTSYLRLNAVWSGEKLFTCVARQLVNNTNATSINVTSLIKVKASGFCRIIGLRFVERQVYDLLELYWRPVQSSEIIKYSLNICTKPEWMEQDQVCQYLPINSSCIYRERDVYKVPNTKGFTRMTRVTGLRWYDYQRAYISSRVQGDSCEHRCSAEKRFRLSPFPDPLPEPDYTEVVLVPAPAVQLRHITRAPRQVKLYWSDSPFAQYSREYKVSHKCSKDLTWHTIEHLFQPNLTLNSNNFQNYRPYDLCRFCVTARAFGNGLDSEPLCEDIRLHQEPPSSAPNITCPGKKCHTTLYAHGRNVSITWVLPPRTDWNGILTEVRLFYRNGREKSSDYHSKNIQIPVQNDTTNGQTALTGLLLNHTYWIEMVACNKEGCSNPGNSYKVAPVKLVTAHKIGQDHATAMPMNKAIILVVGIAAALFTVYLIYLTYTCIQTQRQMPPKIKLKLQEPPDYPAVIDTENPVYDVLVSTN